MRRILVISFNTYSWIYNLSHKIKKDKAIYEVVVVCNDNSIPMQIEERYGFILCEEARYAQRKYDLLRVGKHLGVKKLYNLRYDNDCIDIEKLTISLQLMMMISGYEKVYYQSVPVLRNIIPAICKVSGISTEEFGGMFPEKEIKALLVGD